MDSRKQEQRAPRIVVVGSSNTDMVARTVRFPEPGETLMGKEFFVFPGGKGANQAVASARLGAEVTFVAKVGDDVFGRKAIDGFTREKINTAAIALDSVNPSGVALITVDDHGENTIVVAPGANNALVPADLERAASDFARADVVLAQLEIPLETVQCSAEMASVKGKTFILNPAPQRALPKELLRLVSILTPNEWELEALVGRGLKGMNDIERAAREMLSLGVGVVIVTLGSEGSAIVKPGTFLHVPAPKVKAIDTTAAGDVFNGALAVALGEQLPLEEAVAFANSAAALSVTRMGAQSSAPYRHELNSKS